MKSFAMLVRREFWENRGAFFTTPIALGGFLLFIALLAVSGAAITVAKINGQEFAIGMLVSAIQDMTPAQLTEFLTGAMLSIGSLFNVVVFFVVFFYLLGALYDDRRDRSILFWKSLPISDSATVLSKLVAATVVAPVLSVAALLLTVILLGFIVSALLLDAGLNPITHFWGPMKLFSVAIHQLLSYVVHGFWMLPIWGYLLFISAFAKSKTFLWAVVPPALFAIMQTWFDFTQYFQWKSTWFLSLLGERFLGGVIPLTFVAMGSDGSSTLETLSENEAELEFTGLGDSLSALANRFADADMWWGILVGAIFLTIAIYLRRYRNET